VELARETNAHAPSLYRILRALSSVGVFAEDENGCFELTPISECLRRDAPGTLLQSARNQLRPQFWQAWGALLNSARTGECAFRRVHGIGCWDYFAQDPDASQVFDAAMREKSHALAAAVIGAYDFGSAKCVVDIGGGQGELLAAILGANPRLQGILFDQPHVVAGAGPVLHAAGVAHRCTTIGGSFFERVPQGGDVYLLQHIIHNWDDDHAISILRACRAGMADSSRILVSERLITPGNAFERVKLADLMMLVTLDGARERTANEYGALLTRAGFHVTRIIPSGADHSLIEAVPVRDI
jgi:hypothetical protein